MNDPNKALGDISRIHGQIARGTEFPGYSQATLATTGALPVAGRAPSHS